MPLDLSDHATQVWLLVAALAFVAGLWTRQLLDVLSTILFRRPEPPRRVEVMVVSGPIRLEPRREQSTTPSSNDNDGAKH